MNNAEWCQPYQEERISDQLNPKISKLFTESGITKSDLHIPLKLKDEGCSIFVHGSGITKGKLDSQSDIDFTIIGQTDAEEYLPPISRALRSNVDYISFSTTTNHGRKLSYHYQNPEYRQTYPKYPYATEYREYAEGRPNKTYILGGVGRDGEPLIFGMQGPRLAVDQGMVTITPQTGVYVFEENSAYPVDQPKAQFMIQRHAQFDEKTKSWKEWQQPDTQEILIFGLEMNKMTEDTPLIGYSSENTHLIYEPLARSMVEIEVFTAGKSAIEPIVTCIQGRAEWRKRKDGRNRLSDAFLQDVKFRLDEARDFLE